MLAPYFWFATAFGFIGACLLVVQVVPILRETIEDATGFDSFVSMLLALLGVLALPSVAFYLALASGGITGFFMLTIGGIFLCLFYLALFAPTSSSPTFYDGQKTAHGDGQKTPKALPPQKKYLYFCLSCLALLFLAIGGFFMLMILFYAEGLRNMH